MVARSPPSSRSPAIPRNRLRLRVRVPHRSLLFASFCFLRLVALYLAIFLVLAPFRDLCGCAPSFLRGFVPWRHKANDFGNIKTSGTRTLVFLMPFFSHYSRRGERILSFSHLLSCYFPRRVGTRTLRNQPSSCLVSLQSGRNIMAS
jgi:hypothetical protein